MPQVRRRRRFTTTIPAAPVLRILHIPIPTRDGSPHRVERSSRMSTTTMVVKCPRCRRLRTGQRMPRRRLSHIPITMETRTRVTDPNGQTTGLSRLYSYDARNRLTYFDDPMVNDAVAPHKNSDQHTTSWTYDKVGNKKSQRNANNQLIAFAYDPMNRLLQQTVPQTPSPTAVTNYTYYSSGLLKTMQDPHLNGTSFSYTPTLTT